MNFIEKRLEKIIQKKGLRRLLQLPHNNIDFFSNDYLGIETHQLLKNHSNNLKKGSTGSRLISGNSQFSENIETEIANFHDAESALVFNSGYDANVGLLSALPQRGDTIIYDEYIHASIRDGIRLSFATSIFFKHNDLEDLEKRLQQAQGEIFVAIEALYSMDGDFPPAQAMVDLCTQYQAHLIVDEAHSLGVIGKFGEGLFQSLNLHKKCFARVYTYGKALGIHGAVVVGSAMLKTYLINTARSLIYTTAPSESHFDLIWQAYQQMASMEKERELLKSNISYFQHTQLKFKKLESASPIQGVFLNIEKIFALAQHLNLNGFNLIPIRHPTVPRGQERIRICLHSFNTHNQILELIQKMNDFQ